MLPFPLKIAKLGGGEGRGGEGRGGEGGERDKNQTIKPLIKHRTMRKLSPPLPPLESQGLRTYTLKSHTRDITKVLFSKCSVKLYYTNLHALGFSAHKKTTQAGDLALYIIHMPLVYNRIFLGFQFEH